MAEKTYAKMDIIELVKKYGDLEYQLDQTTLEKRLQEIMEFLNEDRVKYVLEQQKDKNLGGFFYNNEMNLTKAKGEAYKGYDYNLIDAIFLAVLISLFDHPLFKNIRKQSSVNNHRQEEEDWVNAFTNKLGHFETLWDEKGYQKSWEVISVNLESLFSRFTLLSNLSDHAMEIQNKLYTLVELFEELPDHDKITFYNQAMKNRIPTMLGKLEEYVQTLKETNSDEYIDYKIHKKLVEIDRQLELKEEPDKHLRALIETHSDEDDKNKTHKSHAKIDKHVGK
ncbi:hypothetical protein ACKW6F_18890 [Bacillus safensis]|uniref:hypothetical protein n=1 Tax=Bacillus safensis TaxID=561879 RepID=UPI00391700D3